MILQNFTKCFHFWYITHFESESHRNLDFFHEQKSPYTTFTEKEIIENISSDSRAPLIKSFSI